jgi:organic hydroperoxide reductase OsmC/OhrA
MFEHDYTVAIRWTGDRGAGTVDHRAYGRDHVIAAEGKPDVAGSAARPFRGDADRWNPEELLVAAIAQCHMLSYLHVAADAGITVVGYEDQATAHLDVHRDGSGEITDAVLRPVVTIVEADRIDDARAAHAEASALCFIARSVAFPIRHAPEIRVR